MCPPMWAHCRHLANMIELVFPSVHWVHNSNGKSISSAVSAQLTEKVSILYNGQRFPPKLPLLMGRSGQHLTHNTLGPSKCTTKRHLDRFCRFSTDDRRESLYLTMGCPFPLKIAPSHRGIWTPSNTWFPGPTHFCTAYSRLSRESLYFTTRVKMQLMRLKQWLAVTDKPMQHAASRRTCCKQGGCSVWQAYDWAKLTTLCVKSHQCAATTPAFNVPHLHLAPPLGVIPIEFCQVFQQQKATVSGLSCGVVWSYV